MGLISGTSLGFDEELEKTRTITNNTILVHSISGPNRVQLWTGEYYKSYIENKRPPIGWFYDFKSSGHHPYPGVWTQSVPGKKLANINFSEAVKMSVDSFLPPGDDTQVIVIFKMKEGTGWWLNNREQKPIWKAWIEQNASRPNRFSEKQTVSLRRKRLPYHSQFYAEYRLGGYIRDEYPVIINPLQFEETKLLLPKGVLGFKRNTSFVHRPVYCAPKAPISPSNFMPIKVII